MTTLYLVSMTSEDKVATYKEAYDAWQHHLVAMHEFFLDHKRIDPLHLKGVLTREARAKRKYDKARLALLGIEEDDTSVDDDEDEETT
jgi:hypothetical protein